MRGKSAWLLPQELFDAANVIESKLDAEQNSALYNAFLNIKQEAKKRLESPKLDDALTFKACIMVFDNNKDNQDKVFIDAIKDAINNL